MTNKRSTHTIMRLIHRYLGFFLAGIMTVYAISGTLLIFRDTDFLKSTKVIEKTVAPNLKNEVIGKTLRIKRLKIIKTEGNIVSFKNGTYNKETGVANYTVNELPTLLKKMNKLHKATTKDPLFYLNIFFGASLLFFSISAFWMYLPQTKIFKKGLYFTLGGIILTLLLIFI